MPLVDVGDSAIFHDAHDIGTSIWLIKGQVQMPGDPFLYSKAHERKEVRLQYHRAVMLAVCAERAKGLVGALGLTSSDIVALVGAGFGWLSEALAQESLGITTVNIDTSSWLHSVKDESETAEIENAVQAAGILPDMAGYSEVVSALDDGGLRARTLIENADVSSAATRARLKRAYGNFTWAITENVLGWLTDAEAQDLDAAMHKLAPNVAHQLESYGNAFQGVEPPLWNWKHFRPSESDVKQELLDQSWYTVSDWKTLLPNSIFVGVSASPEVA